MPVLTYVDVRYVSRLTTVSYKAKKELPPLNKLRIYMKHIKYEIHKCSGQAAGKTTT